MKLLLSVAYGKENVMLILLGNVYLIYAMNYVLLIKFFSLLMRFCSVVLSGLSRRVLRMNE